MTAVIDDTRVAVYTDGTAVQEGDRIRYRQQPGGLLPASPEWTYGTARKFPYSKETRERIVAFNKREGYVGIDPDELHLHRVDDKGRDHYYYLVGHIVERDQ